MLFYIAAFSLFLSLVAACSTNDPTNLCWLQRCVSDYMCASGTCDISTLKCTMDTMSLCLIIGIPLLCIGGCSACCYFMCRRRKQQQLLIIQEQAQA